MVKVEPLPRFPPPRAVSGLGVCPSVELLPSIPSKGQEAWSGVEEAWSGVEPLP